MTQQIINYYRYLCNGANIHSLLIMNFKRTFQILSKDIEEIENILGDIEISSPEKVMVMRLALSKLKNLRENFNLFGNLLEEAVPVPPPSPEKSSASPPDEQETVVRREQPAAPAAETLPSENIEEKKQASPEERAPEKVEEKKEGTAAAAETEENIPVSDGMHREITPEKPAEKSAPKERKGKKVLLSDTLHPQHAYRNEQLVRDHSASDLSARLSKSAVTDLRKIINVNERFMFIRDLFDGDKHRYEETIRSLNEATTRSEGEQLLAAFKWDRKNEAARRFLQLAQRKLKGLKDG